ncbi:unnamed protein product [Gongylonema pulchrum]|uniref:Chromo domain-containing protein n=1 Tax=Gongylonema pulchrum TaxID=637853 RepID=A0A183DX83_9BILA|nr:unnamed protein product [Gongylonema pulchrum]
MCSGLEQGLDPEEILGATSVGGQLTFLIKWKGSERADMVPAAVANKKWPQLVIGFYEARIQWKDVQQASVAVKLIHGTLFHIVLLVGSKTES